MQCCYKRIRILGFSVSFASPGLRSLVLRSTVYTYPLHSYICVTYYTVVQILYICTQLYFNILFISFVDQSPADPSNSPPDYYELFPDKSSSRPPHNAPTVPVSLSAPTAPVRLTAPVRSTAATHGSNLTTIRHPLVDAVVTHDNAPTVPIPLTTSTDPDRSSTLHSSSFTTIRHPPVNAVVTQAPPSRSNFYGVNPPVNEVCLKQLANYLC